MKEINRGKHNIAIVLLSGGMDSAVSLACAISAGYEPALLHVNYRQLTEKREQKSFNNIGDHYKIIKRMIVKINHLSKIGGSCLTDNDIEVPKANLDNLEIPISYVPFRNANILAIAVSWAEVLGAKAIYIGAVEEDSSGYPDCRKSFFEAYQHLINKGTKPETDILLLTPLIELSKKEIIQKGYRLNVPFNLTWSCYKRQDVPCGSCDSCALRSRGFQDAGIIDPLY